jgi:hypothetical protein
VLRGGERFAAHPGRRGDELRRRVCPDVPGRHGDQGGTGGDHDPGGGAPTGIGHGRGQLLQPVVEAEAASSDIGMGLTLGPAHRVISRRHRRTRDRNTGETAGFYSGIVGDTNIVGPARDRERSTRDRFSAPA